ncbi:MAG: hypothetical protein IAF58_14110 [Leptolyngbya sp.]|nr:hypothetical protein [Candidatus Melainabacteria bacterium]
MLLNTENVLKPTLTTVWLDKIKEDFSEEIVDLNEVSHQSEFKGIHERKLRRMQCQNGLERAVHNLFEVLGIRNAA